MRRIGTGLVTAALGATLIASAAGCRDRGDAPQPHRADVVPTALPSSASPRSTAQPSAAPASVLTGDLDGNGAADTVRLGSQTLTVVLASGRRLTAAMPACCTELLGLADVGGTGRAVVVGPPRGRVHVYAVPAARTVTALAALTSAKGVLSNQASLVTWVDARGRLLSGDVQFANGPTPVYAAAWTLHHGRLGPGPTLPALCWDTHTSAAPLTCAPGQDYRPTVGPHGDLPRLFPEVSTALRRRAQLRRHGVTVHLLTGHAGQPAGGVVRHATVVLTDTDGVRHVAAVPPGFAPSIEARTVAVDGDSAGTFAFVVSQEGGDSTVWSLFTWDGATLQRARAVGRVRLGNHLTAYGGYHVSWISREGMLYTREALGTDPSQTRFDVQRWSVTPATVAPHDLGTVCIDTFSPTPRYGTC